MSHAWVWTWIHKLINDFNPVQAQVAWLYHDPSSSLKTNVELSSSWWVLMQRPVISNIRNKVRWNFKFFAGIKELLNKNIS